MRTQRIMMKRKLNYCLKNKTDNENQKPAPNQIKIGSYVVVEFSYDGNSKKKTIRNFPAFVKKFALDEHEVHCMRSYKGKKDTFVFPEVADIAVVKPVATCQVRQLRPGLILI
jgi:hypothetical protein